ncbi:hypothetical protein BpHYR1_053356 [Brachionus plicatilis]|uniref:Uncharacterized protein n=1 Tax=Brachionus plicatilis TaxID=10195 RepID=A0A3M7QV98_BRAPC|nr:hypothetical protein BpHYR1_053356 [Brachionus plicatilis]
MAIPSPKTGHRKLTASPKIELCVDQTTFQATNDKGPTIHWRTMSSVPRAVRELPFNSLDTMRTPHVRGLYVREGRKLRGWNSLLEKGGERPIESGINNAFLVQKDSQKNRQEQIMFNGANGDAFELVLGIFCPESTQFIFFQSTQLENIFSKIKLKRKNSISTRLDWKKIESTLVDLVDSQH